MRKWFEKYRYWINVPAMTFLGMIFIVAGSGKLLYQSNSFAPYPFLEYLPLPFIEYIYLFKILPYIEIAIGALLIHGFMIKFAATLAALLVALFTASNIILVSFGLGTELCGCFGMAGRLTYTEALTIDFMMGGLIAIIFACQRGRYFNLVPWFLETGHKPQSAPSSGTSEAKTIC